MTIINRSNSGRTENLTIGSQMSQAQYRPYSNLEMSQRRHEDSASGMEIVKETSERTEKDKELE